jgi:hypothetical protein
VLWLWVTVGVAGWLVLGVVVAFGLGRGIRVAEDRSPHVGLPPGLNTADLPVGLRVPATSPITRGRATRRRAVPLPSVGVGLIVLALGLETAGYVVRLRGTRGEITGLLSMDAPFSVPRMFVAGLFAVAALAALAGATMQPHRRTWWSAVALVAALVALIKAGSTVHVRAVELLALTVGTTGALVLSAAGAAGVLAGLWFLSRKERRDRRRVLATLGFYAVAAVGLSALSGAAVSAFGVSSTWAATATYVEEAGEALAAVAYLVAVLVGVAPQLVLPREWVLRRQGDEAAVQQRAGGAITRAHPGSGHR